MFSGNGFPDVNDRSINSPAVLVGPHHVLKLHRKINRGKSATTIDEGVKKTLSQHAIECESWGSVQWVGNQMLLIRTEF